MMTAVFASSATWASPNVTADGEAPDTTRVGSSSTAAIAGAFGSVSGMTTTTIAIAAASIAGTTIHGHTRRVLTIGSDAVSIRAQMLRSTRAQAKSDRSSTGGRPNRSVIGHLPAPP